MHLNDFGDLRQIAVERALAEIRAGRPIVILSAEGNRLALPIEGLSEEALEKACVQKTSCRIVVPAAKAQTALAWPEPVAVAKLTPLTSAAICHFLDYRRSSKTNSVAYTVAFSQPHEADIAALALINLGYLLPAALVMDLAEEDKEAAYALRVNAADILNFRDREADSLKIVSRTFVPLEGVDRSEFVVFRGGDGFRDQIAVIVSNPSPEQPVLVRIHSACLTGDLFGSLKCDCGDQLRGTVRAMSEKGGGIVLYLDQEGRGNGIANKIRAYGLQAEGLDTYDADAALGFGQDQRRFDFAAHMLKQLGFSHVKLMTNNPNKIEALRQAGLDVVSTERVNGRPNAHNVQYLTAKRDKAGHLISDAALMQVAPKAE